jgi:DNA-directed RNA polymerase subunit omega
VRRKIGVTTLSLLVFFGFPPVEELFMARAHDSMVNPPIEDLLDRVDSKFSLVTLAARRARQINSYFNHLGDGLGTLVPPQVTSVARKPLSIGFEEIAADKIVREPYPVVADEDAAPADA